MQPVSAAWSTLIAAFRTGVGASALLGIFVPSRNLLLTSQPWPALLVPAGAFLYPYLAPFGQGIGALQLDLADDRSSRVGNVLCQLATTMGQRGAAPDGSAQLLLSLGEQGATVLGAFTGGALQDQQDLRVLFTGRFTTPRLTLGRLTLTLIDGASADHRPIEVTIGTDLFPGSPLDARGQAAPLVIGTALGLQPLLIAGMATGTLATPLSTTEVDVLNLVETAAAFGTGGSVLVEGETVFFDGRRVTLLPDGTSTLQLLRLIRAAPVAHPAGALVETAPPIQYRSLVGIGLPRLELLAVRDQDGPITNYAFETDLAGLPPGTALLNLEEVHEGVSVDVQVEEVPPPAPLLNGGFETGDLTGWTPLPGATAVVPQTQDAVSGNYLLRLSGLSGTPTGIYQDVPVVAGERYTLLLNWRAPVQVVIENPEDPDNPDENLIDDGDFTDPDASRWEPESDGMPDDIDDSYTPGDATGPITVNGAQTFTLPPAPFSTGVPNPDNPNQFIVVAAGYRSFSVSLTQDLTVTPGLPITVDVRVQAWLLTIENATMRLAFSGAGPAPGLVGLKPACEQFVSVTFTRPDGVVAWQRFLQPDQPSTSLGRLAEFTLRGADSTRTFLPDSTAYTFRIEIFGRYIGEVPPIVVNSVVVLPVRPPAALRTAAAVADTPTDPDSPTGPPAAFLTGMPVPFADEGSVPPLQAVGVVQLGTPADPALYTTRILLGPTGWQRLPLAFRPDTTTLRISLLARTAATGAVFDYDGLRFLPAGRNPVRVMAEVFARFLPHLTLDQTSVETAAACRDDWLFSGWIPEPGRTDTLLTTMSQQCACTLYKDVRGIYRIVADEPETSPALTLDAETDLVQGSTAVDWLSGEQVYTDFYLWYQRVSTQVTTTQAGQYAAVLYVTPDGSLSSDGALQYLCAQAAQLIGTRRRFEYYADFIADPGTAERLLGRLVHQYTSLPVQVSAQASLPAVPLDVTDRIAIHSPLVGASGFVGDVRQLSLSPSATAPGIAVAVSARSVPGAPVSRLVETWDYFGAESVPLSTDTDPDAPQTPAVPGALRVRETWDEADIPPSGDWFLVTAFVTPVCFYALRGHDVGLGIGGDTQLYGAGGDRQSVSVTLASDPPAYRYTDDNVASGLWDAALAGVPAGRGTALGTFGGQLYCALQRPTTACEVWRIRAATSDSEAMAVSMTAGTTVWSLQEHNWQDGTGNGLFLGTDTGRVYRWDGIGGHGATLVEFLVSGPIRSMAEHPATTDLWLACEDTDNTRVLLFRAQATGAWPFQVLTGVRCSNLVVHGGTLWVATGTAAHDTIHIWRLPSTPYLTWELQHSFTGLMEQWPSVLASYGGVLSLGRQSTSSAQALALWQMDSAGVWSQAVDFATEAGAPDSNTSVMGLAPARGKLYAATGTPGAGPGPGVKVYVHPTAD